MKLIFFLGVCGWWMGVQDSMAEMRVIEPRRFHLGVSGDPEYDFFATNKPDARRLDIRFNAKPNWSEATLFLWQDDVKQDWPVELNGHKLGKLFLMEAPLVHTLAVPAGSIVQGENLLSIIPPKERDDIFVGEIALDEKPYEKAIAQAHVHVQVTDAKSGEPMPCRLTITDLKGSLMPLQAAENRQLAVRPGVVYTARGDAEVGLWPGQYIVYATRGFAYGVASNIFTLARGHTNFVKLQLMKEVETPGWISCDTHVHTYTLSHHGDATLEERAVTLAGEGIDLPVATDHNIFSDYSEAAEETGTRQFFTPIAGDEVTTKIGHFNIFPIEAGSNVPDETEDNWPLLLKGMRATPGVQVVVLNHPLNVHNNFQPFAATNFNHVSGESLHVLDFGFDAMELINSSALQSDMMGVVQGWFALLNAGHRIVGVGSSDVHDVSRYIVGQGRTYIAYPAGGRGDKIKIERACETLKQGRALVSLGLLTDMRVQGKFKVGDLATRIERDIDVSVTVQGPSWVTADKVQLFANGLMIREERIAPSSNVEKARLNWKIRRPAYDFYLVALASGPGVSAPFWPTARPYQPTSRHWEPQVVGITNPIWVDADGDGKFTSAHGYAELFMKKSAGNGQKLIGSLAKADEAMAVQTAALWRARGGSLEDAQLSALLAKAPEPVRKGFEAYKRSTEQGLEPKH